MFKFKHLLAVMTFLCLSSSIDNGVGLTPPMGWRSWNCMHGDISDERIRATIDAITSRQRKVEGMPTSIADLGYDRVGIDDGWQACNQGPNEGAPTFHDKAGKPLVNTTLFPNLADLVSYGKSKSVKMGWYINNCICHESGGRIGGPTGPHGAWVNLTYKGDVDQIVEAGFDGVKVDNCGLHNDIERYASMLNKTGKPVLIEECAQGKVVPTKDWCPFNMFRTGGDIRPSFSNVMSKLQRTIPYQALTDPLSRPGCWAYPDMLEVGNIGGSLAHVESRSHFGGWCVVSAPLILGLDLTNKKLVDSVWDIISNREAIAINQAWAGHPGRLVNQTTSHQVWAKKMPDGGQAVLVINTGKSTINVSVVLGDIGLEGTYSVRDVWAHSDLGRVAGRWKANGLRTHDSAFVRFVPASLETVV